MKFQNCNLFFVTDTQAHARTGKPKALCTFSLVHCLSYSVFWVHKETLGTRLYAPSTFSKLGHNYHRCEELVLNRHRCQWQNCEEMELNAKCSRFRSGVGGILSMWGIHMNAIWNLTSCVFFTKCEILVYHMWRIGTKSSQCEIYEVSTKAFYQISFHLDHLFLRRCLKSFPECWYDMSISKCD